MKLGSIKSETSADGQLVVVSRDNQKYVVADSVAPSLRHAVEDWANCKAQLESISSQLNKGDCPQAQEMDEAVFHSPLPRTFQWADGSAFLHHVKLVRMARGGEMPERLFEVPLMYQGAGDSFLAPREDIPQIDFSHGTDFEGEVGVVTGHVPMGATPEEALERVVLFVIINDVSLRGLIPSELSAGFGFLQGKPSSSFAPFAVTADELGDAWKEGRIHLPLLVDYNGEFFGKANADAMHFHFGELIAHAARTRHLMPGTIIGSGTVSNDAEGVGSSCLAEKRMIEKINEGAFKTPFMKVGDTVKIEMRNTEGQNIFGTIEQKVAQYEGPK